MHEALKYLREAKDRLAQSEFEVGRFYARLNWCPGAVDRLQALLKSDPDFINRDGVYFYLGECYCKSNQKAQALPYYDKFPLILLVDFAEDGFYGLNLHYLAPVLRAKLMDALYTLKNNDKYDDTTKLKISYRVLKGTSSLKYYAPCFKRYLYDGVKAGQYLYVQTENWDKAEAACRAAAATLGVAFSEEPGEAAFYGPKIDFVVHDSLGRKWQLGTVQLDYNLPSAERFDCEYIGADNARHKPVMIHRAPLGSLERFVGVLIEHFAGAFPLWLAPEQVRVLPVSEKSEAYAKTVKERLEAAGLRVGIDLAPEKLGAKVRSAQLELIPMMVVCGPRDEAAGTVSLRDRLDGDFGAIDRKSTRLNSSHTDISRMPSSA